MNSLDKLLETPLLTTSDQVSGQFLDSTALLKKDVWQIAIDHFDVFAEVDANAGLSLEQQQYLTDLRVDRSLYDTLADEFELLQEWLTKNPGRQEAALVASFMRRRAQLGERSRIDRQEDLADSILGWRLLCRELADSLLAWSGHRPDDPRGRQIRLWQDSPGFYPQNRLRIWAVRFVEDARAAQILAWETAVNGEIDRSHPELLAGAI
jgi:hypothetical protein